MTPAATHRLWLRLGSHAWVRCEACGHTTKHAHGEPFVCKNCLNDPSEVECGPQSRLVSLPNHHPQWSAYQW
jgi:hypothetical protein